MVSHAAEGRVCDTHLLRTAKIVHLNNESPEASRLTWQAIDSGKPIPTELREEEAELRHQIELEDEKSAVPWSVPQTQHATSRVVGQQE